MIQAMMRRVGAHVRRRDVVVGADDDADLGGVAARQALQLAVGERCAGRR